MTGNGQRDATLVCPGRPPCVLAEGVRLRPESFGGVVFESRSGLLLTVGRGVFAYLQSLGPGDREPSAAGDAEVPANVRQALVERGVLRELCA